MKPLKDRLWYLSRFFVPEALLRLYEWKKWLRNVEPVPIPDPARRYRVLITPAKHAGQGKLWSDALDRLPDVSSRSVTVQGGSFGHDAAYQVSWGYACLSRRWQRELSQVLREHFTHILVEASVPPLGGRFGGDFQKQIRWLQGQGLKVGFIAHGSEIRLPSRHSDLEQWSPFSDPAGHQLTATLESIASQNAHKYREFPVPSFVSTAGLKIDLPEANFLGLVVEAKNYVSGTLPLTQNKIIACHVSSHSVLKATSRLSSVMEKLQDEGLIEFRNYSGVSHEMIPQILAESDIVLDQFALGDYGVFACEGMASGRVVLSHVSEQVRAEILRSTGHELPIPETTLENIEWRVRDIVANRERYQNIAQQGQAFVQQVHSGGFSASVLRENFLTVE